MIRRALIPTLLCASIAWPLHALACGNSMESSEITFTQPPWAELLLWSASAVTWNRFVLVNIWGPTAEGQSGPFWLRRSFSRGVGAALVVLLTLLVAGGPLLGLSEAAFSRCSVRLSTLLMLVLSPVVLFTLQAALFHEWAKLLAGKKGTALLVSLVVSSAVLVLVMAVIRDSVLLPELCQSSPDFFSRSDNSYE